MKKGYKKNYKSKAKRKRKRKMAEVQWNPVSTANYKIVKPKDTEYRFSRFEVKIMPLSEAKKLGDEFVIKERS